MSQRSTNTEEMDSLLALLKAPEDCELNELRLSAQVNEEKNENELKTFHLDYTQTSVTNTLKEIQQRKKDKNVTNKLQDITCDQLAWYSCLNTTEAVTLMENISPIHIKKKLNQISMESIKIANEVANFYKYDTICYETFEIFLSQNLWNKNKFQFDEKFYQNITQIWESRKKEKPHLNDKYLIGFVLQGQLKFIEMLKFIQLLCCQFLTAMEMIKKQRIARCIQNEFNPNHHSNISKTKYLLTEAFNLQIKKCYSSRISLYVSDASMQLSLWDTIIDVLVDKFLTTMIPEICQKVANLPCLADEDDEDDYEKVDEDDYEDEHEDIQDHNEEEGQEEDENNEEENADYEDEQNEKDNDIDMQNID